MRNIKLTISYDGTRYKGWQIQKNASTIQEKIERSIEKVFGKKCRLYAAGRTDSGVHAKGQVANFKAPLVVPISRVQEALNSNLPEDIAITKAEEVSINFHSQYDAKRKKYSYHILNSRQRDPFTERYAWRVPYRLNVPLMRKEAKALVGKHDFKSFQATDKAERTSVRKLLNITINKNKSFLTIDVEADGFLYNMVRNIIGTLIDIGRGYLPAGSMKKILKEKNRTKAGPTAPPNGLFLVEVKY